MKPKTILISLGPSGLRLDTAPTLRVTGLDPGSTATAFARLSVVLVEGALGIAFGECGDIPNEELARWVARDTSDILGIERPEGRVYSSKGAGIVPHLLQAANAAGIARGAAEVANETRVAVSVLECPAVRWRKDVVGKGSATNAEVKAAVLRLVGGWPKRSDNHERDAAGVAIHAARVLGLVMLSGRSAA